MNDMQMKGKWNQLKGYVQKKWGKLTNDDMDQIQGNKDMLVGKLQDRYGYTKAQAEAEVNDFMNQSNF